MKSIALLRHAKSSWDDPALDDFDRPLSPRGERSARLIGAEMRQRGFEFDLVIASPARRASDTVRYVEEEYAETLPVTFDRRIYDSSISRLLKIVREVDQSIERLLLVGHNPEIHEFAILLSRTGEALLHNVEPKFPTGALALLEVPAERWEDVALGAGQFLAFIRPRDLKQE